MSFVGIVFITFCEGCDLMADYQHSRLVSWEIFNFMSISHAMFTFDETNIINIKGYNDSGKSAALRALDVLFFNVKPSQQVKFIKDDCTYFRVVARFEDGVLILRDKYINGQGLYEMYKGDQLIYTTKQNGELMRINAVPDVIQKYLALVVCDAWNVNSRSCFEKQLLVETKGSENAQAVNALLRAEELATASALLNTDKNKLNSAIGATTAELEVYKKQIKDCIGVSGEMLEALKSHDARLDSAEQCEAGITQYRELNEEIASIPIYPELTGVNMGAVSLLDEVMSVSAELKGIPDIPQLSGIDTSQINALDSIQRVQSQLDAYVEIPSVSAIDISALSLLMQIGELDSSIASINDGIVNIEDQKKACQVSLAKCEEELQRIGHKFVKCQACGTLVDVTDAMESA